MSRSFIFFDDKERIAVTNSLQQWRKKHGLEYDIVIHSADCVLSIKFNNKKTYAFWLLCYPHQELKGRKLRSEVR